MADYDDKTLGRILPVRDGGADTNRERTMLDAIGGADSFRTRIQTNPDGSVTRLRTRGGNPEFVTTPAPKEETPEPVTPVESFTFYAVPASASHVNGYVPPSSLGAACRWDRAGTGIPAPHGTASPNGTLTSFAATGASGEAPYGAMTWYSDKITLNGKRVVVSWRGPNVRSGRWGSISGSVVSKQSVESYSYLPSSSPSVSLNPDIVPLDSGRRFGRNVWIGGPEIKLTVDVLVWCAGIREVAAGQHELVVVGGAIVYTKLLPVPLFTTVDGVAVINPALNGLSLSFSGASAYNGSYAPTASLHWTQVPFLNASCTKFITIIERTAPSPTRSGVVEFDVATAEATWVFDNYYEFEERTAIGVGTGSWSSSRTTGMSGSGTTSAPPRTFGTYQAFAADYIGDKAVFLGLKSSNHSGGYPTGATMSGEQTTCVIPYFGTGGGYTAAEYRSRTHSITDEPGETGVDILHSRNGKVGSHAAFSAKLGTATIYDTESISPTPTPNVPYTHTWVSGGSADRFFAVLNHLAADRLYPEMAVVNADLRHGVYVVHTRLSADETHYVGSGSGSWTKPFSVVTTGSPPYWAYVEGALTGSASSTGTSTLVTEEKVRCSIYILDQEVWAGEIDVSATTSSGSSALGFTDVPMLPWPAPPPGVKTVTDSRAYSDMAGPTSYTEVSAGTRTTDDGKYFPWPADKIPAYCHVAVSDDGKAAYIDLKTAEYGPSNTSLRKAFFLLDGVVHDVADGYYAPGLFSTLCAPIFYPKKP